MFQLSGKVPSFVFQAGVLVLVHSMHDAFLQHRITAIHSLLLGARRLLAGAGSFCFLLCSYTLPMDRESCGAIFHVFFPCFWVFVIVCYDLMFKVDILFAFELYHPVCILVSQPC